MKFFIKLPQNWEESLKDLNNYCFNPSPAAHLRAQEHLPSAAELNALTPRGAEPTAPWLPLCSLLLCQSKRSSDLHLSTKGCSQHQGMLPGGFLEPTEGCAQSPLQGRVLRGAQDAPGPGSLLPPTPALHVLCVSI